MLQVSANEVDGSLSVPLGSKLTFWYRSKKSKNENVARLSPGPEKNHFIALFEQDDVDFEIGFENLIKDRSVCFNMEILDESRSFIAHPNTSCKIKRIKPNERKFQFPRQLCEEGRKSKKAKRKLTRQDAPVMLSEIKFKIWYSELYKYSIFVQMFNGKTISVEVNRLNTVADLKEIIASQELTSIDHQVLHFKGNHLDDDKSMEELDITENMMLNLKGKIIGFNVKIYPDKIIRLEIDSFASIENFKTKIEEQEGIPVRQQRICYNGYELHDSEIVWKYYNVRRPAGADYEILLFNYLETGSINSKQASPHECCPSHMFPVNVNLPDGKFVTVHICALDTAQDLIIKVQAKEGTLAQNENLQCYKRGIRIEKFLPLEVYDISKDSKLSLYIMCSENQHYCVSETGQHSFLLKNIAGKTLSIPYCSMFTIETIKAKIQEMKEIPADQLLLTHVGIKLEDEQRPLRDYSIRKESTLEFVLRSRGCGCRNEKLCRLHRHRKNKKQNFHGLDSSEFDPDNSIVIKPFTVELRLAGFPVSQ